METHEKFAALLDAFVDGELSPEDMQAVQTHLNECPDCQAYVDDALAIRAAFPTAEETEVPAGFAAGVLSAIQAETAPARKRKQPWGRLLLPIAACFALVLVLKTALPAPAEEEAAPAAETPMEFRMADAEPAGEAPVPETAPAGENGSGAIAYDLLNDAVSNPYFVHITLDRSEVSHLLDDYSPLDETELELLYELSRDDYQLLLKSLVDRGIVPAEEVPAAEQLGDLALVTVLK